jgi:hypothetical protein
MSSGRATASPRVLVAVLLIVFLAGMAARGLLWRGSASDTPARVGDRAATGSDATKPGPASFDDNIPVGFSRSEAGARSAAANYVLTGQVLLGLAPTEVPGAVRVFAAAASVDTQVSDAQEQLRHLRGVLVDGSGPIRYVQAVLATRVDAYSPQRARVSVWSVGVLARAGAAPPQAGWTVSTFELVWERQDWKVWSETITPGPAPLLNGAVKPAGNEEFDRSLNGFVPWQRSTGAAP